MALHSPAMQAHRPGDSLDPRRNGEYAVLLGESLRESGSSSHGLISLRYNFKPNNGFATSRSVLTKHKVGPRSSYKLIVEDEATHDTLYTYNGRDVSAGHDQSPVLALVFDKAKSAFVLESIPTSFDFNLASAPAEPGKDVQALPQLSGGKPTQPVAESQKGNRASSAHEDGGDSPDPTNPYDYRHFLEEAREAAEASTASGSKSPLPGSRTPMSVVASPVPGASRFLGNGASTPQFRPSSSSAPVQKKPKIENTQETTKARHGQSATRAQPIVARKKTATQRKRGDSKTTASQPLSSERISDSDSESDADGDADMSDTITVARMHPSSPPSHRRQIADARPTSSASTSNLPRSPHIVVDDPSGLEIDMGSPPRAESARKKRLRHVNRDAFRSQTGTPTMSYTPLNHPTGHTKPAFDMEIDRDNDNDILMSDGDVEELELGSPRTRTVASSHPSSRLHSVAPDEDDDEDDALAAELEAALEEDEEEQEAHTGVGLGISGSGRGGDDDESEVSEEE